MVVRTRVGVVPLTHRLQFLPLLHRDEFPGRFAVLIAFGPIQLPLIERHILNQTISSWAYFFRGSGSGKYQPDPEPVQILLFTYGIFGLTFCL